MNSYGERYLRAQDFLRHCETLNVKARKEELEHYEKTGVMFPVVRLTMPESYVIEDTQLKIAGGGLAADTAKWPELQRLDERLMLYRYPDGYEGLTGAELVHCFDREIDTNSLLTWPDVAGFRSNCLKSQWATQQLGCPGRTKRSDV